jgi:hypothetical protein
MQKNQSQQLIAQMQKDYVPGTLDRIADLVVASIVLSAFGSRSMTELTNIADTNYSGLIYFCHSALYVIVLSAILYCSIGVPTLFILGTQLKYMKGVRMNECHETTMGN